MSRTMAVLGLVVGSIVGCGPQAGDPWGQRDQLPAGLPRELGPVTGLIVEKIDEQGVIKDFAANARGHGLEPGMEAYVGVETTFGVRLSGVDLDLEARTKGEGVADVSSAVRQYILEAARAGDPAAIALAQREFGFRFEILPGPEPPPTPDTP